MSNNNNIKDKRITLRLNDELYSGLAERASDEYRSMHSQILWFIRRGLQDAEEGTINEMGEQRNKSS